MRIPNLLQFSLLFLLITFWGCQKETIDRPFARIQTLPATEIDSTGVTLHAEVLDFNEEAVTDYGFIWISYDQNVLNLPPDRFSYKSLGSNLDKKEFSTRVDAGLEANVVYYVRAYIRSAKSTVYGEAVAFTSKGGFAPVIEKVTPELLTSGDTMTIVGNYFINVKENGKVQIGREVAELISATTTEIRCIVPRYIVDNTSIVIQSVTGQSSTPHPVPKISTPEIYQLLPNEIVVGDTATIIGRYFSPRKEWNEIYSVGTGGTFQIVNVTPTKLQFIPFIGAFGGTAQIAVRVGERYATTTLDYSLAVPIIEDFYPKQGTIGDTLTILGKNFYPDVSGNRISFGDGSDGFGWVVSASQKELKVVIQELDLGLNESLSAKINIAVGGKKTSSQANFTYLNRDWKRVAELPTGLSYSPVGFVLQDKLYFSNDGTAWWTYNVNNYNWQMVTQTPQVGNEGFSTVVALTVGEEAFVIQRNPNAAIPLHFWRYRPAGNQWIRAANLELTSDALTNEPLVAFSVGQEVFLCLSGRANPCFKLNILTDSWTPIESYIPLLTSAHDGYTPVPLAAVSFNQKGYLLSPQGGPRFLLEYYPGYNNWNKVGEYLNNAYPRQHSSFVYKDKIYFISLNYSPYLFAFEWNPSTKQSRYYPLQTPPTDVNFGE